jgi:hypothetical protein
MRWMEADATSLEAGLSAGSVVVTPDVDSDLDISCGAFWAFEAGCSGSVFLRAAHKRKVP